MNSLPPRALLLFGALVCAMGCGTAPAPPAALQLSISVTTEARVPVENASVSLDGVVLGSTGPSGQLALTVYKPEGTVVELAVECPVGFQNISGTVPVALRRLSTLDEAGEGPALRQRLLCNPTQRSATLVISTGGIANVPVLVDGAPQVHTNAQGFAHVFLQGEPGSKFQVSLDTALLPELRPQAPSRSFAVGSDDAVLTFEQPFKREKPRVSRKVKQPAVAPYRVD